MERVSIVLGGRVYNNGKIKKYTHLLEQVKYLVKNEKVKSNKAHFESSASVVKFIDDEGDFCSITSEDEYVEARRISNENLILFVFEKDHFENMHLKRKFALKISKAVSILHKGHILSVRRGQKKTCAACDYACPSFLSTNLVCQLCKLSVHKNCLNKSFIACPHHYLETTDTTNINGTKYYTAMNNRVSEECSSARSVDKTKDVKLSDFELVKVIGQGSYSKVLLVKDLATDEYSAVKAVKKQSILFENMNWVFHEKKILKMTKSSPFFVKLKATFQDKLRVYFLLEFVAGGDLMYLLQKRRALKECYAQFYLAEIICALDFLHRGNVLYRDLKLDNILIADDGHVKLTDFGLCKIVASDKNLITMADNDETWTFCGTPNCIAPEIILERPYGISVDWWCLGIIMYEILIGKSPFEDLFQNYMNDYCDGGFVAGGNLENGLFQMIVDKDIRMPRSVSVKAGKLIKSLLIKEPKNRIGCPPDSSVADIQSSPFFKEIDWELANSKGLPPPLVPSEQYTVICKNSATNNKSNNHNLDYITALYENFDKTFLKQLPELSEDENEYVFFYFIF